jgi:hypothetical protein
MHSSTASHSVMNCIHKGSHSGARRCKSSSPGTMICTTAHNAIQRDFSWLRDNEDYSYSNVAADAGCKWKRQLVVCCVYSVIRSSLVGVWGGTMLESQGVENGATGFTVLDEICRHQTTACSSFGNNCHCCYHHDYNGNAGAMRG